jgi:hypothetical protein
VLLTTLLLPVAVVEVLIMAVVEVQVDFVQLLLQVAVPLELLKLL